MNRQMWQPSVAETNFSPVKMMSPGPVRDDINPSPAALPVRQPWTMPDKGTTIRRRMTADPFERLHGSPTKMLSQRGAGLIPSHKLTGRAPRLRPRRDVDRLFQGRRPPAHVERAAAFRARVQRHDLGHARHRERRNGLARPDDGLARRQA